MRRRLAQLNDLQQIQRVERDLAALDHVAACTDATNAQARSDRARDRVAALDEQWYAARALGNFEPELDTMIAARLIAAELDATREAGAFAAAEATREERAGAWRLTEARRRATARIARDAQRAIARAQDEARLDLAAARILERPRLL